MKYELECSSCLTVIGTLEKPVITEYDKQEYSQMVSCDCGGDVALVESSEEPGNVGN